MMYDRYLKDGNMVGFTIKSDLFNLNERILVPLSLVNDIKDIMDSYSDVAEYPFNTILIVALMNYVKSFNCEFVPFSECLDDLSENQSEIDNDDKELVV